ncbi:hypothetical protein K443DRAFT_213096 [Laccaria amethystina LaAM-08-1]|uniref:Uncharacterized protein n=1 Tax=Laccaria amethystina LaAM-08-1 TaxID=1095629 RepID=A0A0C9WMK9_9AGAR|nr:hypothetical protein K443DRAFT_213096 [Laccaria amethystina LaAM-08-1]
MPLHPNHDMKLGAPASCAAQHLDLLEIPSARFSTSHARPLNFLQVHVISTDSCIWRRGKCLFIV